MTFLNKLDPKRFTKLAAAGLRVFPVLKNDKKPAVNWTEYVGRAPSNKELQAWGAGDFNVGIICGDPSGGTIVLDVDSEEAQALVDVMQLPTTPVACTGRGKHYFFKAPGSDIRNSVNIAGQKLDIRGNGGYVVGAGSIHPTGARYEWLVSPTTGPGWFEIFNLGSQPVLLSGNYFTDNLSDRTKYQIPSLTFVGGSGASRWQQWMADENNSADYGHVNFTLSSNQYLGLFAGNGVQLDARATESPAAGISQGLYTDGNGVIISLLPTPGGANVPGPADTDGDGIPDDWELLYGLDPRLPLDADTDGDGDGLHNLLEFAFNLNPVLPDIADASATSGLPVAQLISVPGGTVLEVSFLQRRSLVGPGLDYSAAFSSDLFDWGSGLTPTVTSINEAWERVTVRDSAPAGSERRFGKVVITVNPPQ